MEALTVAGVVFAATFGGTLLGMVLRRRLPETHLNHDSKDVVRTGTGLLATLAALVLGLLLASAKGSYDAQRAGFQQLATNLIVLDRALKVYGPEAAPAREHLRRTVGLMLDHRWPADRARPGSLDAPEITASAVAFYAAVRDLPAPTDAQKATQAQALQVSADLARTRWQLSQGEASAIPLPFLVVLVAWLAVLFVTFGLFATPNGTVVAVLAACALSLAGALFLIVELDQPFDGLIQVSSKPLRDALGQLGR